MRTTMYNQVKKHERIRDRTVSKYSFSAVQLIKCISSLSFIGFLRTFLTGELLRRHFRRCNLQVASYLWNGTSLVPQCRQHCRMFSVGYFNVAFRTETTQHGMVGWQTEKDLKGNDCGLIYGTIQTFVWRDWWKPRRTPANIAGTPAGIPTKLLHNTILKQYLLSLLCPKKLKRLYYIRLVLNGSDDGFLDFFIVRYSRKQKTRHFGKWMFPSSSEGWEDTYSVGSLRESSPQPLDNPC
jgi:hypothetical protein